MKIKDLFTTFFYIILLIILIPFPFWIALIFRLTMGWEDAINTLFVFAIFFIFTILVGLKELYQKKEGIDIKTIGIFAIYAIILLIPKLFFSNIAIEADKQNEFNRNQLIENSYFQSIKNGASDSILVDYLSKHSINFVVNNGRGNEEHYNYIQSLLFQNKLSQGISGLLDVTKWDSIYYQKTKFTIDWDSTYIQKAQLAIDSLCNKFYNEALEVNTIDAWKIFQAKVNPNLYRDSQERINSLEQNYWKSDKNAWELALKYDILEYYQKYLDLYPKGEKSKEAIQKVISFLKNDKNILPPLNKTISNSSSFSFIHIKNSTSYTLYVYFSGKGSKYIVIPPNSKSGIRLVNGEYEYVATVKNPQIRDFWGIESLNGGEYQTEFYIDSPNHQFYRQTVPSPTYKITFCNYD